VAHEAADDHLFFLASGVTFSVMVVAVPFQVLLLSVAGLVLAPQLATPQSAVLDWLWQTLPLPDPGVRAELAGKLSDAVAGARSTGVISGLLFIWFSTVLFGSLRTALGKIFNLHARPGMVWGKVLDVQLVVISTALLVSNIGITSYLGGLGVRGLRRLGIDPGLPMRVIGLVGAFAFIYLMFLLIFKFVPTPPLRWRLAAIAALFAGASFELLKAAFAWYVANFVDVNRLFFAFATFVVVVASIYYAVVLFLLGGEVAKVYERYRERRRRGRNEPVASAMGGG